MIKNLQEYYAQAGSGKSTQIIPAIMYNNFTLYKCKKFIIVGVDPENTYEKDFLKFYTKQCGFLGLFSLSINIEIKYHYLPFMKLEDYKNQLREYLSQSNSDTNIIIDEIGAITQRIHDEDLTEYFVECLKSIPYKQITLVGQSKYDFRDSLYL